MENEKQHYHHGDLRKCLLHEAIKLIESEGVHALSLRKVARAAGVSAGAPYHHFKSRSDLLIGIAIEGFALLKSSMADHKRNADKDGQSQFAALGRAYATFALAHPGHFRVMFRAELMDVEDSEGFESISHSVFSELVSTVYVAQGAGTIPSGDPRRYILLAWSACHGVASLLIDGPLGLKENKLAIDPDEIGGIVADTLAASLYAASRAEVANLTTIDAESKFPDHVFCREMNIANHDE